MLQLNQNMLFGATGILSTVPWPRLAYRTPGDALYAPVLGLLLQLDWDQTHQRGLKLEHPCPSKTVFPHLRRASAHTDPARVAWCLSIPPEARLERLYADPFWWIPLRIHKHILLHESKRLAGDAHPRSLEGPSEPSVHYVYGTVNTHPIVYIQTRSVAQMFSYSQ